MLGMGYLQLDVAAAIVWHLHDNMHLPDNHAWSAQRPQSGSDGQCLPVDCKGACCMKSAAKLVGIWLHRKEE